MLVIAENSTYSNISKLEEQHLRGMVYNQKKAYYDIHNYCFSMLTPLEQDFLKNVLDFKGCYISNVAQADNGKYVSIFIPGFPAKSYLNSYKVSYNEITFKKQDGSIVVNTYPYYKLPRLLEVEHYESSDLKDIIGFTNGYGWKVVHARVKEKLVSYQDVLY